jgi:dinuclear metal center YbgI/SA1388 family protein
MEWIIRKVEEHAPPQAALPWDNQGFLVGEELKEVKRLLVALDCTDDVVDEAAIINADAILTHHPIIMSPVKDITSRTNLGRRLIKLIRAGISVYCAHTSLDMASCGTNDWLASYFDLVGLKPLMPLDSEEPGLGRAGLLPEPIKLKDLAALASKRLDADAVRFVGNPEAIVRKMGLCAGGASGSRYFREAKRQGCDVYMTGDIKYHEAQGALEIGLNLIDATHYASEAAMVLKMKSFLLEQARKEGAAFEIIASKSKGQVFFAAGEAK